MWSPKLELTAELFGVYMEVGEIKISDLSGENCRFVELWVGSCFRKN